MMEHIYPTTNLSIQQEFQANNLLGDSPIAGLAFLVASAVANYFNNSLSIPLSGIGLALIASKLVLKIINHYNEEAAINIKKKAYKINELQPKMRLIAFVVVCATCSILPSLSFLTGCMLGTFGAVILDVERYKSMQRNRRAISPSN